LPNSEPQSAICATNAIWPSKPSPPRPASTPSRSPASRPATRTRPGWPCAASPTPSRSTSSTWCGWRKRNQSPTLALA